MLMNLSSNRVKYLTKIPQITRSRQSPGLIKRIILPAFLTDELETKY